MARRIGVFVCWCGSNIARTVETAKVVEAIKKEPNVVYAVDYKYMCSDPGQKIISDAIKTHKLDGLVVAACSPSLHEPTFRRVGEQNGINPYLVEIANIREQCSWVHLDVNEATEKAIDLVRMMVGKVRMNEPLQRFKIPVNKKALVIGGGIAGIQAALDIANAGYPVTLVERLPTIGGRMAQFDKTFPTLDCSACILTPRMVDVAVHPNIELLTWSEVEEVSGYVGNFTVKIRKKPRYVNEDLCTGCGECITKCPSKVDSEFDEGMGKRKAIYTPFPQSVPNIPVIDREHCIYFTKGKCRLCEKVCEIKAIDYQQKEKIIEDTFGAIVVATGIDTFDPAVYTEYGVGRFPDVITGIQFERLLNTSGPTEGHIIRPSDHKEAKTVVFIQCVGARDDEKGYKYCSRLCCMYTAKHAILLKDHVPDAKSYVFYIDVRATGKNYEEFWRRACEEYGATYIRGRVSKIYQWGDKLMVMGTDTLLGAKVEIEADLVVLSTALVAKKDAVEMAQKLGIQYDENHFFTELHPKLGPVETSTSGLFIAGACQSPRDIPDTVASAGAAAVKVCALFSKDYLIGEPTIAVIDNNICSLCLNCVRICPYSAPVLEEVTLKDGTKKQQVKILESLCHGCGACVAGCRALAITLKGFSDEQIEAQIFEGASAGK